MMTKYEQEKHNEELRSHHLDNIKELRAKIEEAKNVYAVIPKNDYESNRERLIVRDEIRKLSTFLEDEERAFKSTFEDESNAEEVFKMLSLSGGGK